MSESKRPFQRLGYQASIDRPRLSLPLNGIPIMMVQQHRAEEPYERTVAHMAARLGTLFRQGRQVTGWYLKAGA